MTSFVPWLANLNIKRNVTLMFVNKKYRYLPLFLMYVDDFSKKEIIWTKHIKLNTKNTKVNKMKVRELTMMSQGLARN